MNIMYARLWVQNENGAKFFEQIAFAIVFLQGKYAGSAVHHMLSWAPDILFNIDLGLINLGTEKLCLILTKDLWTLDQKDFILQ